MVVDIAKLSVGREDYYLREVANNREEYLTGHGESPGRWLGQGAAALGQEGTANTEAFVRMFHGRHPDTGQLLGRHTARAACPPSTWCSGRPRACRCCTAWATPA